MRQNGDEWSLIVNKQAQLNRAREQEESQMQRQAKDSYKQDLQYQNYLKELEREQEKRTREAETQEVAARAQFFQADAERRRQEEAQQKKSLADEYRQRQEEARRREEDDRSRKLAEEQQQLDLVRQQMEAEERRKKAQREDLALQEQRMQEYKRKQEELRAQQMAKEREMESQLVQSYVDKEEKKEQGYREFYQKVQQSQEAKVSQHQQTVTSLQQERDSKLNMWILQNQEDYQQRLALKETREREIRLAALQDANRTVQLQIQEKERQRQAEAEELRRLKEEAEQRLRANREFEEQKEAERRQQQLQYREVLNVQTSVTQDVRIGSQKLSDFERKMNKALLEGASPTRSTLQNSASQMLKGYDQNAARFYGVTPPQTQGDPQFEANMRAFYGDSKPPSAKGAGTWEKDAKAFFGADSVPQSRAGAPGTSDSFQRNARNFYGSDTPAAGTRPPQPDFPARPEYAYEAAPPATSGSYQRNAKLFYGADTPAGDSPTRRGATSDSYQKNAKLFFGAETPDVTSGGPVKAYALPTDTAAGRRQQKDPPWTFAQGEGPVGTSDSWRQNAKNFYGSDTPDAAERSGISPMKGADVPAGKRLAKDPAWSPALEPPPNSSESFQRNARKFYGSETPDLRGRQAPDQSYAPRNPGYEIPPETSASYQRNEKNFFGADTPNQTAGGRPAYRPDVQPQAAGDPTWSKNVQAFYGDSRPASNGFSANARAFYGDSTPGSAAGERQPSPSKRFSSDPQAYPAGAPLHRDLIDRTQHNPITNPIGSELPGATQDRPLYRGRKANF